MAKRTKTFTITIDSDLAITTPDPLPGGISGQNYNQALAASGGSGTYAWKQLTGTLPPGLSLGINGVISGFPSTEGVFTFEVEVESPPPGP